MVKDGGFDPADGAKLRSLFELRNAADYSWLDPTEAVGVDAISTAETFVQAVEDWIAARPE